MDVIELGCGTAYVCAWLAQRGARPVGVDISDEQLDSARMFQRQFHQPFPLIRASADDVPFDDQSFDLALSEYGASTWVDPYWWVPEAARLLRPGGKLVFFVSGAIMMTCTPSDGTEATRALVQDYFGIHRFEFRMSPSSSSTSRTAIGSGSCAPTGSSSRASSRCNLPRGHPAASASSPRSGRALAEAKRSGSPIGAAEPDAARQRGKNSGKTWKEAISDPSAVVHLPEDGYKACLAGVVQLV